MLRHCARRDAIPDHQAVIGAPGHLPVLFGMKGMALRAAWCRPVIGRPVAEIVARLAPGMEDTDMLIAVAGEQALRLRVSAGRIADQHAVLGGDHRTYARYRRLRQFEYVA
ncbi:hypothetical protein [Rhizobium sp. SYY.PMSO]|uniref:hypothetical protein n=1 Tax=Rhizobium sp. SYY.PMSO TaxID=3382192 RepID=UPI00398FD51B